MSNSNGGNPLRRHFSSSQFSKQLLQCAFLPAGSVAPISRMTTVRQRPDGPKRPVWTFHSFRDKHVQGLPFLSRCVCIFLGIQ